MKSICVVGVGSIGRRQIDNFKKYFEKIDIVDVRADRIEEARSLFNIDEDFDSYVDAFNKRNYDAVAITVPPHLHLPVAEVAVNNGSNLFIEKPLGMSVSGWNKISDLCNKNNLISYIGYNHRHIPLTTEFKKIIDSGKIGEILHGNMRWGSYLPDWHPWEDYREFYMAKKEQGGGALLDESHGIDLVRYILGNAKEVFAMIDKISNLQITSDDSAFLTLRMDNNVLVQINFDLTSRTPRAEFELIGTEGTIIWDRINAKIKFFTSSTNTWEEKQNDLNDNVMSYAHQSKHFINCINGKERSINDIDNAIETQKIIDAAFESEEKKKLIVL